MLDTIRETAAFIFAENSPDRIVSSAEALYGMTSGSLSPYDGIRVLSLVTGKELTIEENVPNRATAFVVSAVSELHENAVKGEITVVKELAEVLRALPEKSLYSDRSSIADFNCKYIAGYNSRHSAKLHYII